MAFALRRNPAFADAAHAQTLRIDARIEVVPKAHEAFDRIDDVSELQPPYESQDGPGVPFVPEGGPLFSGGAVELFRRAVERVERLPRTFRAENGGCSFWSAGHGVVLDGAVTVENLRQAGQEPGGALLPKVGHHL